MIKVVGNIFNNAKHNHEQDKYDKWFQRAEETLANIVLNRAEPCSQVLMNTFFYNDIIKKSYISVYISVFLSPK